MTLAPRAVRRAAPLLALAGALSAWPLSLSEVRADTPRTERIRFQTNVPASSIKPVGIEALLYLPAGTPPFSAVVITPSSGGEKVDREHHYAQELAREGIAGLVVESFRSRNLKSSVRDQSVLSSWETANDAIGAFR